MSNQDRQHDPDSGQSRGAVQHAEGQQGEKTHAEFLKNLHNPQTGDARAASAGDADVDAYGKPKVGGHRLQEDRQQHDEAERNSEANREEEHDIDRHGR